MNEKIEKILEGYESEMIEKLQELVRINSVATTDVSEEAPFGKGIKEAYDYMMDLGKDRGFKCTNYDNKAGEIVFGSGKESVGVLLHVDVVPPGKKWEFDPFGAEISDGKIYGRGTVDDKGPCIATFYACLAIKESGLPLKRSIKQVIGCNEEGGYFPCLRHYIANADVPSKGIVPDAWFPAVFAEKHFYTFKISKTIGEQQSDKGILKSIKGGEAANVVPSYAEARFEDIRTGSSYEIKGNGKAAHASTPALGENGIADLLKKLKEVKFANQEMNELTEKMAEMFTDCYGKGLGIDYSDDTGELTNNLGLIEYDGEVLELIFNIRHPISFEIDALKGKLKEKVKEIGFSLEDVSYMQGMYVEQDDPTIKILTEIYREATGDVESKPLAHGGGSYARLIDGFIPFGPSFQNEPLIFHQENEYIKVDRVLELAKMYAEALYRLAT